MNAHLNQLGFSKRSSRYIVVLLVIAMMIPIPGCLFDVPDDPDTYIGTPYLVPTEWNGTVHWEAQFVLFMYNAYDGNARWKNLRVELHGTGALPFDMESSITKDNGSLTDEPRVFYIDREAPDDMLHRNDVIRVTGLGPERLPVELVIVWPNSKRTSASILELPQASLIFGRLATAIISDNVSGVYRTILLNISDLYPNGTRIGWGELTVNVVNPMNILIYFNTSLTMRLNGTRPLVHIPPSELEHPVTVAYISNDTDHIHPGDALYFPGLHRDMVNSMIEVWWSGELIGRRIML